MVLRPNTADGDPRGSTAQLRPYRAPSDARRVKYNNKAGNQPINPLPHDQPCCVSPTTVQSEPKRKTKPTSTQNRRNEAKRAPAARTDTSKLQALQHYQNTILRVKTIPWIPILPYLGSGRNRSGNRVEKRAHGPETRKNTEVTPKRHSRLHEHVVRNGTQFDPRKV